MTVSVEALPAVTDVSALTRLAAATSELETHRDRLVEITADVELLRGQDIVVVDGERKVIEVLNGHVGDARRALSEIRDAPDRDDALRRLEALVDPTRWRVLDVVAQELDAKVEILRIARNDIQQRLGPWTDLESEITSIDRELREMNAALPPDVAKGRDRLLSLIDEARRGLATGMLLQARSLIEQLDEPPRPSARSDEPAPVTAAEVKDRLAAERDRARQHSRRLQLTVLRGPLDERRFEYTLMLLTPGGDHHVGVNVQDTSTIVVQDRQYLLEALDAIGGSAYRSMRGASTVLDPPPVDETRDARAASEGAAPRGPSVRDLQDMGSVLYKLLIPDRMKEELVRNEGAQLTITTNDLELPWELMFDGEPGASGDFIALQRPFSRMPVGRSRGRRAVPLDARRDKRRVALIGSTGQPELTAVRTEIEGIRRGLEALGSTERVEIVSLMTGTETAPTGSDFRKVLLADDFDIVHYAGHAAFDPNRPDQSGLLLDDGEVCFAQKIQRLLGGQPLVFLNACESARLTETTDRPPPEGTYEGDPRQGLASAFVYGGALACIGATWPVTDRVAADYAVSFYQQVLEGRPLGQAMLQARLDTAARYPADLSWAAFVLYGDPSYQLPPLNQTRAGGVPQG